MSTTGFFIHPEFRQTDAGRLIPSMVAGVRSTYHSSKLTPEIEVNNSIL